MRRVHIKGQPPADWVADADTVTDQLHSAADAGARKAIIEAHEGLWRDERIRAWLRAQFNSECWFSEAHESASAIHVDHFPPKGRIKNELGGDTGEGYWLLAFARHNCGLCVRDQLNRKRKETWDQSIRHVQDDASAHKTCGAQALKLVGQASAIKELNALTGYGAEFSSVADACIEKEAPLALKGRLRDPVPG